MDLLEKQVDHPDHYGGDTTYEMIKVMEAWDPIATYYFCRWSAVKYLSRTGKKQGEDEAVENEKSAWYTARAAHIFKNILTDEERKWLKRRPREGWSP